RPPRRHPARARLHPGRRLGVEAGPRRRGRRRRARPREGAGEAPRRTVAPRSQQGPELTSGCGEQTSSRGVLSRARRPRGLCTGADCFVARRTMELLAMTRGRLLTAALLLSACATVRPPTPEVVDAARAVRSYTADLRVGLKGPDMRGRAGIV